MTQPARLKMTPEEYLAFELDSLEKHELIHGELFAMAGASAAHNRICANLLRHLGNALEGTPCTPYAGDLRVQVGVALYTYPDITVVCGEPEWAEVDTLLNPTLLVEVVSPSTERWDRGGKFELYQRLPSLREYLIVSQDAHRVERFTRRGDEWPRPYTFEGPEAVLTLSLPAGEPVRIPLSDLYYRVALAGTAPGPEPHRHPAPSPHSEKGPSR